MLVALGERHRADGLLELVGEVARPGLGVPHLARGVRRTGHERLGIICGFSGGEAISVSARTTSGSRFG